MSQTNEYPSYDTAPAGSIRFNTDSSKLELYNGEAWWEIDSTSPEEQTGGTRGVIAVGYDNTTIKNNIQYIKIDTTGNAIDFGDLTVARGYGASWSSRTRGCFAAGQYPNKNVIDYVTIASEGNAIDFGDITDVLVRYPAGLSDATRGVLIGGYDNSNGRNEMRYVTIASTGDTVDFGDTYHYTYGSAGLASPTRGIIAHGANPSVPTYYTTIEYFTIQTTGNTSDFGDSTTEARGMFGCSNAVRGIFAGGYYTPGTIQNVIDYITIASQGNAVDFGDLTSTRGYGGSVSSPTRAVFCGGGHYPSVYGLETIDYVQIATLGNAVDFGDFIDSMEPLGAMGCSNGHGGLG